MEKENAPILVVTRKETDPGCVLSGEPVAIEVIGLYHRLEDATADINRCYLERMKALRDYYEEMCRRIQQETAEVISEIATDPDPVNREFLRESIADLGEKEKEYRSNMVPEMLVLDDEDGDLCEITARDDRLDWTCSFDIEKMHVK